MSNPLVSAIITTKNEEKYIESCLNAIKQQSYRPIEIIVSDANSIDRTVEIAKKYSDRVIVKETFPASQGRNLGAKYAKGDILVFIDADTVIFPQWIEKAVTRLNDKKVVAVVGVLRSTEKRWVAWRACWLWSKFWPVIYREFLRCPMHPGCAIAVKREVFEKINGYDERMVVLEDVNLCLKLNLFGIIALENKCIALTSMRRYKRLGFLKWNIKWVWYFIKYFWNLKTPIKHYKGIR